MRKLFFLLTLFIVLTSRVAFGAFVVNGDGTVTDTSTMLIWQQQTAGSMTWEAAISYCEGLSLGGHDDWRLPNTNELQSLVDYTRYYPAIDTAAFPDTMSVLLLVVYYLRQRYQLRVVRVLRQWLRQLRR